jgi:hypothetical protein
VTARYWTSGARTLRCLGETRQGAALAIKIDQRDRDLSIFRRTEVLWRDAPAAPTLAIRSPPRFHLFTIEQTRTGRPNQIAAWSPKLSPGRNHIMAPTQITAAQQMDDPRAISTTAAAHPLPIAVWPLLVIAVALTATFAWVGLLIYVTVAVVTYALF